MRSFIIYPPFETVGKDKDEQTEAALDLIAEILCRSLRQGRDTFLYSVVWTDPGSEQAAFVTEGEAVPTVVKLETEGELLDWLRLSVDPNTLGGGNVRSIATCRCATYGYDGQAFLCLRHEDEPPSSPDDRLAIVEENPVYHRECDYFDGWDGAAAKTAN